MFFPEKSHGADERKRQKQLEYHAALDRDAQRNSIHVMEKLPRLDAKQSSSVNPPRPQRFTNSSAEFVEKLDTLAKTVMDNDIRLHRVEKSMKMGRSGIDKPAGDVVVDALSQLEMVSTIREFQKAKAKIDELQSILASEIKSRNHSEEVLQQQLALARPNQSTDDGGLALAISRIDALGDQVRTVEDMMEAEKISIASLREKLTVLAGSVRNDTRSQLQDIMTDIDNGVSLHQSAKEEIKRLFESVETLEKTSIEHRDLLESMGKSMFSVEADCQKNMERLKAKLTEDITHLRHIMESGSHDVQDIIVQEASARSNSVRNIREELEELQGKIHAMDNAWQASLNEGLRSMNTDVQHVKDSNSASLHELREVLSAEITSRRKTTGKINSSIESLNSLCEKNTSDIHALAGEVEERFSVLDANICKVTGSFSEQIGTLKTATKTAVRTLQAEQKSLGTRLDEVADENKRLYTSFAEEIKRSSERQDRMEAAFNERMKALDKTIESMVAASESRHRLLEHSITKEAEQRHQALQNLTDVVNGGAERLLNKVEEASADISYKVTMESQTRVHMLKSLEARLSEIMSRDRAAASREIKSLEDHMTSNLSYALASETQKREECLRELESRVRDGDIENDRKILHTMETMKNTVSYAVSMEAQTRAHCINGLEGRIKEAMRIRSLDFAGDVETVQTRLSEQSQALAANIISVESRLIDSMTQKYDALSDNVRSIDHRLSEESGAHESLASSGTTLEMKLTETRNELTKARKDTDELRNALELFIKESLGYQERVQAMQSKFDELEITKEMKDADHGADITESDVKALVEMNKVKNSGKDLTASCNEQIQSTLEAVMSIERRLDLYCSHSDMDDLEVRYTVDRLVTDVIYQTAATTPPTFVVNALEQIAKVDDSVRTLSSTSEQRFQAMDRRVVVLEDGMETVRTELREVDGATRQYTDSATSGVAKYVDDNVSDVLNKEVVSSTLSYIIDNIVESDMVASIDDGFDSVRMELKLEVLEHIQKVLSVPLNDLQNRQSVTEEKLEEYDIAYIQKKLRDFERSLESTNDEVEALKTDVNEDLKEQILRVVAAVDSLAS